MRLSGVYFFVVCFVCHVHFVYLVMFIHPCIGIVYSRVTWNYTLCGVLNRLTFLVALLVLTHIHITNERKSGTRWRRLSSERVCPSQGLVARLQYIRIVGFKKNKQCTNFAKQASGSLPWTVQFYSSKRFGQVPDQQSFQWEQLVEWMPRTHRIRHVFVEEILILYKNGKNLWTHMALSENVWKCLKMGTPKSSGFWYLLLWNCHTLGLIPDIQANKNIYKKRYFNMFQWFFHLLSVSHRFPLAAPSFLTNLAALCGR